jgi:uncharacterized protein YigA (DUF484 family)
MDPQTAAQAEEILRDIIIKNPRIVLDDSAVMRTLVSAHDQLRGENIVDLRSVAMKRLETRLDRLEVTHRSVIGAAYDNLSGTQQINRAILKFMEPVDFGAFLWVTVKDIPEILRIDFACLVLETKLQEPDPTLTDLSSVLIPAPTGFVDQYLAPTPGQEDHKVTLRSVSSPSAFVYATALGTIASEACLRLDFGAGTLPGLLVLGSQNPNQFSPAQGTDLLSFFGTVYERAVRRWLS